MEVIHLTDHIPTIGDIELTDAAIIEVHEGHLQSQTIFLHW
jgi:hypothetical protein